MEVDTSLGKSILRIETTVPVSVYGSEVWTNPLCPIWLIDYAVR